MEKIRNEGGIKPLIKLLEANENIQIASARTLRNMAWMNEDSRLAIREAGGIGALINLLRKTRNPDVQVHIMAALWNLAATGDLCRRTIIFERGAQTLYFLLLNPDETIKSYAREAFNALKVPEGKSWELKELPL